MTRVKILKISDICNKIETHQPLLEAIRQTFIKSGISQLPLPEEKSLIVELNKEINKEINNEIIKEIIKVEFDKPAILTTSPAIGETQPPLPQALFLGVKALDLRGVSKDSDLPIEGTYQAQYLYHPTTGLKAADFLIKFTRNEKRKKVLSKEAAISNKANPNSTIRYQDVPPTPNNGTARMTGPFVKGVPLNSYLTIRRFTNLNSRHLLSTFYYTALDLARLHAENIIHRDIKPLNVIVSEELVGNDIVVRIKIIDFGLSTQADKTDHCYTTPLYASPEVARLYITRLARRLTKAELNTITYAADLYSLGKLLAEMFGIPLELFKNRYSPEGYLQKEDIPVSELMNIIKNSKSDLSESDLNLIEAIFTTLLDEVPQNRGTIFELLERLEKHLGIERPLVSEFRIPLMQKTNTVNAARSQKDDEVMDDDCPPTQVPLDTQSQYEDIEITALSPSTAKMILSSEKESLVCKRVREDDALADETNAVVDENDPLADENAFLTNPGKYRGKTPFERMLDLADEQENIAPEKNQASPFNESIPVPSGFLVSAERPGQKQTKKRRLIDRSPEDQQNAPPVSKRKEAMHFSTPGRVFDYSAAKENNTHYPQVNTPAKESIKVTNVLGSPGTPLRKPAAITPKEQRAALPKLPLQSVFLSNDQVDNMQSPPTGNWRLNHPQKTPVGGSRPTMYYQPSSPCGEQARKTYETPRQSQSPCA